MQIKRFARTQVTSDNFAAEVVSFLTLLLFSHTKKKKKNI